MKVNSVIVVSSRNYSVMADLRKMPTVCLIASDKPVDSVELSVIVTRSIENGCLSFMTVGSQAEALENEVDKLLEARSENATQIVTSEHGGESVKEVAWYATNVACADRHPFRIILYLDASYLQKDELVGEVTRLC